VLLQAALPDRLGIEPMVDHTSAEPIQRIVLAVLADEASGR
jgi:hypothetical protein